MNPDLLIGRLEGFATGLRQLITGLSATEARWRPTAGGWSILEVVCHLADEEEEDFRARMEMTLHQPDRNWPPIDPEEAVEERNYNERDLAREAERFQRERMKSIAWLKRQNADWTAFHEHPKLGKVRAGDLLVSWAAHDALHLRQIARRMYDLAARDAPGFSSAYAGSWSSSA